MPINASGELVIGVLDDVGRAVDETDTFGCTCVAMDIKFKYAEKREVEFLGRTDLNGTRSFVTCR